MSDSPTSQRRAVVGSTSGTRAALLDAGRVCVRQHGLAGTTSRMIAEAAGANLASITYYFGGKDELLADALFGELSARLEPAIRILEEGEPTEAPARMMQAVQQLLMDFDEAGDDVAVYLHALMSASEGGPLADRAQRLLGELQKNLAAVIERLRDDQLIARWVQPGPMAALLVAAANGMVLQSRLDPQGPTVRDLAEQLVGLLLAAGTAG